MSNNQANSFNALDRLTVGGRTFTYFRLDALEKAGLKNVSRLPYSLKILLENLLRFEDGRSVTKDDIKALAAWNPHEQSEREIAYRPARVLLQDFTGVPCVVDLAVMRDAMAQMGGDPKAINPLQPVELVIDHSVQVDYFGSPDAMKKNADVEFERNRERYAFLKWGQAALNNFRAVPPDTGIVHQVNIEFLARVIFGAGGGGIAFDPQTAYAYPDTVVGTDSHTTMANGLGVLAWGVGGIEAEAAMLGQPVTMLIPEVIGFRIEGQLREGVTATDLVLTVTEMLRKKGVVGKFVEFYGKGLSNLSVADRVTIGNMSPEYGSTCAIFPIDAQTLEYLRLTGRSADHIALVEEYAKAQGMFRTDDTVDPHFTDTLSLDLGTVEPNIAGPRRPQDRVPLQNVKAAFNKALEEWVEARDAKPGTAAARMENEGGGGTAVAARPETEVADGSVVIAAITSCTNTSNPSVLIGAGLLARNAIERGLQTQPWVKTSLAPGSKVVTDYLAKAGLQQYLDQLGFNLVGYGCTTCIGNSGPLIPEVSAAVNEADLAVTSVLSGNRNFEGRINPDVKMNYLASPPLVVAYALAGSMKVDLFKDPLGQDQDGNDVFMKDIWPSAQEVEDVIATAITSEMFSSDYADVFAGDAQWQSLPTPEGKTFEWDSESTYVRKPPYFDGMPEEPTAVEDIEGARVLLKLGDSVTTDHISPAGAIKKDSPAGKYLAEHGVEQRDFNSYGSRRGNHEVMIRGTFANIRLRNQIAPGTEGGFTRDFTGNGDVTTVFEASEKYIAAGTPLVVLAGKEYGSGSSRDWAAKGTSLLGVKAVIAESYERIHRSNLIGMGVIPLQFPKGESAESLGLTGEETFSISGITELNEGRTPKTVKVTAGDTTFDAVVRIDTPGEANYYRNGGIMQYVLRNLRKQG
ncbi:MAG: aconitate hydratase AcnA [Vulcanimicrobiaceae bacterium]